MSSVSKNPFSAIDAALGYLYQVRLALLWALRRLKSDQEFLVSVETLDDVTFETIGGDPTDLLQSKHHRVGVGSLTDASPDIWKTLRIWFEGYASGHIPATANLYLVTTGTAPSGTAASYLQIALRDVSAAQSALNVTALSSTNKDNTAAYQAYLSVSEPERLSILERVVVLDAAPCSADIDDELRNEIYWVTQRENHLAFLDRLEGWWFRRVLRQLSESGDRIGSVELESQMSDLREQFKQESLPIDDDLLDFTLDDATSGMYEGSTFVRQLELINAGKRRIAAAIRDYFRAYEQRSRWLRDDLVVGMDLHKYERRLIEEWEIVFEAMRDELGDAATDEVRLTAARALLAWVEKASIPIRPNVTEPFLCRGSFHMLADEVRVGWHPDFRDRLALVLSGGEASA